MLKILFSPSEAKNIGGIKTLCKPFGGNEMRQKILEAYNAIILSDDQEAIKKLFGFKKFEQCQPYLEDIFTAPYMPAIARYSGVAYEYLDYASLNQKEQQYLQNNLIIFSNLYGPLLAGDAITNYKVKQTNTIGEIAPERYYKEYFSELLDSFLADEEILDLRAGYYEKFYKLSQPFTTLKFLKDGKTVSHWAKAYRGVVLRALATDQITSLTDLHSINIDGLTIKEILIQKNKTEIIYEILNS